MREERSLRPDENVVLHPGISHAVQGGWSGQNHRRDRLRTRPALTPAILPFMMP